MTQLPASRADKDGILPRGRGHATTKVSPSKAHFPANCLKLWASEWEGKGPSEVDRNRAGDR